MTERPTPREMLIEAAVTAHRERDPSGQILPSPAWCDLASDDREAAFVLQLFTRRLERTLDPDGLTTTAHDVLGRARRLRQD